MGLDVLLLGGPGDGKRVRTVNNQYVIVIREEPSYRLLPSDELYTPKDTTYHVQSIRGSTREYFVATPDPWTDRWDGDRIIETLLKGYGNGNHSRCRS